MKLNNMLRDELHKWVDSLSEDAEIQVPGSVTREKSTVDGRPFQKTKMEVRIVVEEMEMLDPNKPESYLL